MPWYAVRTVYHFGIKADGKNIFEERVVCFEATGWPEAHEKAERESSIYAQANNFTAHPEHSGYEQDGDTLIDGYELWSELFESPLTLGDFYADRYAKYEYHPE